MSVTTILLRRTLGRPLTVTELDSNFSNLKTSVDGKTLLDLVDTTIASPANNQFLIYDSTSSTWKNLALTSSHVTTALGFTPANSNINLQTVTNNGATTTLSVTTAGLNSSGTIAQTGSNSSYITASAGYVRMFGNTSSGRNGFGMNLYYDQTNTWTHNQTGGYGGVGVALELSHGANSLILWRATGGLNPAGNMTSPMIVSSAGDLTVTGQITTPTKLLIGSGAFLTNSYFRIGQGSTTHIQGNIQNTTAGTTASSDWVATANTGTDTANFINMGINSSTNADPAWTIAGGLDGYLFTNGGHLTIGTQTAAKSIKFFTGGTLAANLRAQITDVGLQLYSTATGANPSLILGGNAGGDTDFWISRVNDNDSVDDDTLQIGKGLTPGTTPYITLGATGTLTFSAYNTAGFLKTNASGVVSVDATTYLSAETDTLQTVTTRGATTTANVTTANLLVTATEATLKVQSTTAAKNTQLRLEDNFVAFGLGIRANEVALFQYPLTSSADNIAVTGSELLLGFNTSKQLKLSTTTYTTQGFLKLGSGGVVSVDINTYLTGNQTINLSGDVSGSGATGIVTTLATQVGLSAGTYTKVTVNTKGLVTSAANIASSDVTTALGYTPVNKNGDTMTGLLTLSGPPTAANHAVTKAYVDALKQGLSVKTMVRAATTANITLSGTQTLDGVAVVAGDRVLVKDQTTKSQNGYYVVAAGAWVRADDMDEDADVVGGSFTFVKEGTLYADTGWVLTTNGTIVIGTTLLDFTQFSTAGIITAGTGLTKVGNSILLADTAVTTGTYGGAGVSASFTVNQQGQLTAASNVSTGFSATFGNGTLTSYTITHNLNSRNVIVQVFDTTTFDEIRPDVNRATVNTVVISGFTTAVATNKYTAVVHRVI